MKTPYPIDKKQKIGEEDFALTAEDKIVVLKLRQAKKLAEMGHRSRMEIMFYDNGKSCDITIEDRERVVEKIIA